MIHKIRLSNKDLTLRHPSDNEKPFNMFKINKKFQGNVRSKNYEVYATVYDTLFDLYNTFFGEHPIKDMIYIRTVNEFHEI